MFRHTTFECGFVNNNVYGDSMIENCSYGGGPFQPRHPFSNTYNQEWMNYPNFLWSNNQNSQVFFNEFTQPPPLEFQAKMIDERFIVIESKFKSKFDKFIEAINSKINSQNEKYDQMFKNHSLSIHNIEVQLGQLANLVATRAHEHLPSNTKVNPKEQGPKEVPLEVKDDKVKQEKKGEEAKENSKGEQVKKQVVIQEKQMEQPYTIDTSKYAPRLPFPLRQRAMNKDEKRFAKFMETFKELEPELTLFETLNERPKYAKVLKDIINNKKKWDDNKMVLLTETSNSIKDEECKRDEVIDKCESAQEPPFVKPEILVSDNLIPPSIEQPPSLWLKPLPSHLRYIFLGENDTLPIIISNKLSTEQENRVCEVISKRIKVMEWKNSTIEGLSLSNVVHKLYMKDSYRATKMKERGVKFKMKEILISPKVCKDNSSIFYNAFELCLSNLDRVLQRCEETNLIFC